ncbi:hypothetical protein Defa_02880 [Desulfovibrio sp. TH_2024_36128]|uniref:Uncharacterized protein n=2 Tax=Desulfovibrio falkowii TaxID=3136602 RepID=A0ABQ0E527_9BACT
MRKDANTQRSGVTALPVRRLYGRLTWNGIAGYMFFAQYITVARAGTRTGGQVGRIKEFATIPPIICRWPDQALEQLALQMIA